MRKISGRFGSVPGLLWMLIGITVWGSNSGGGKPVTATAISSLPVEAQAGISAAVGRDLSDYQVRQNGPRFEASSLKRKLTAGFTATGVEVRSGGTLWKLALQRYGYSEALRPVTDAAPHASANRIEYRRGALTEWYVNGPAGIEQGFTFNERPHVERDDALTEPLTIALALNGGLRTALDYGRRAVTLTGPAGTLGLRYSGLQAEDATGRDLPAWMEVQEARLLIHVDDSLASYPVVIDPLMQLAELTGSDASAGWQVGSAVAVSGNTIVVGACGGGSDFQGTAYVFVKPLTGWKNMTQTAELTPSDGATSDDFGCSAAISGNTVVIGAFQANVGQNKLQGAAYIFVEPAGGWTNMTETAKLTSSDGAANDGFGYSCSIFQSLIAIGATGQLSGDGAVYVYTRPASGWQTTSAFKAKLTASDLSNPAALGWSVATDGKTIVAGAPNKTDFFGDILGAVYVFVVPKGGWKSMTQTAELTATDGLFEDFLGSSVAISGGTIAAGAREHAAPGKAYVFLEPPGGWMNMTQTAELTSTDGTSTDLLGNSISINGSGNVIVAGAPNPNFGQSQGAVYVFVRPGGGWVNMTQSAKLTASDGQNGNSFGISVAITGITIVAGASGGGPPAMAGAAYVF
ncbi:MAG TPA: FG-GAP repeat protein [Terriglobia bacterium]|nr:FG-GAP repeat protein [Terriglobia bacterium]